MIHICHDHEADDGLDVRVIFEVGNGLFGQGNMTCQVCTLERRYRDLLAERSTAAPQETARGVVLVTVHECSACGSEHPDAAMLPLDKPIDVRGVTYTHGFTCPEVGDPVLSARVALARGVVNAS